MRNATILMVNLKGVATEAIKNIVLAGIGKLIVVDPEDVAAEDLGAGFFYRDEDVGRKVSEIQAARADVFSSREMRRTRVVRRPGSAHAPICVWCSCPEWSHSQPRERSRQAARKVLVRCRVPQSGSSLSDTARATACANATKGGIYVSRPVLRAPYMTPPAAIYSHVARRRDL